MGSKELLSREGEIAIAKRIEAGREAMIAGLCEIEGLSSVGGFPNQPLNDSWAVGLRRG
jgi:hypothetical protein